MRASVENKQLWGLGAAFAAVAAAFILSTVLTEYSASRIDAEVVDLQTNSLPSVAHLATARTDVARIREELDALQGTRPEKGQEILARIESIRTHLNGEMRQYSATPFYEGERELYEHELYPSQVQLDATLDGLHAATDEPDAFATARRDVGVFDRALAETLDVNHAHTYSATNRILVKREQSTRVAAILEGLAAALAVLATVLALRASRRFQRVLNDNIQLQAARAEELEGFAHRVAHDLLNPVSAVAFGLSALSRKHPDDASQALMRRTTRALDRARRMVHGILTFARAGARPSPGARARLDATLRAAIEDLVGSEPDAPPAVAIEPFEDCEVACDEVVLSVILSNLLGNSAKFTKDSPERTIHVRARIDRDRARVEVEDTGPGVARELEEAIFEPYVRAPGVTQPGLGLGLATVKRMVVAHGGRVGARAGKVGACFWFELPLAPEGVPTDRVAARTDEPAEAPTPH
jgi:signal transduction histidine kinase